jgi:hypothetical protein
MINESEPVALPTVSELISQARDQRGLSFGDIARLLGASTPRQTSKLSQRIVKVEREHSVVERRLISRLGDVLAIDQRELERALDKQRAEELRAWLRWLNEPMPMELHLQALPGVWFRDDLPELGEAEAIQFASSVAAGRNVCACLALNRQISVWFDRDGEETGRTVATPSSPRDRLTMQLE